MVSLSEFKLDDDIIATCLSLCGSILAVILNFSPLAVIKKIFAKKVTYETISESLLISSIGCAQLWNIYWIKKRLLIPSVGSTLNLTGAVLTTIFYLFFRTNKRLIFYLPSLLVLFAVIASIYYFCGTMVEDMEMVAKVAVIANTLRYAAPLQKIYKIIKTQNYLLIPIEITITGLINSGFWFAYGVLTWNKVGIPNGIGVFLSLIQVTLYYYYKAKSTKGKKGEKGTNVEGNAQKDEKEEELNEIDETADNK